MYAAQAAGTLTANVTLVSRHVKSEFCVVILIGGRGWIEWEGVWAARGPRILISGL